MTPVLDALGYPFRGDDRGDALVAGWALLLAHGILPFVPLVPVLGVVLRVLERSASGVDEPPPVLEDVPGLLRGSLGAVVVAAAYAGPPLAYLLAVLHVVSGSASAGQGSLLVLVAATVGGIALLIGAYLLPVGLLAYASSGSLVAAFDRSRLRRGARSGRYLLGWLAGVVVLDVGGLVAVGVAGRSAPATVLAALLAAYALLVAARLIGRGLAGVARTTVPGRSKTPN